jgi:hypothetical protein
VRWLREFAKDLEMAYEDLLQAANDYLQAGEVYCLPFDTPDLVYDKREDFWKSIEIVTGAPVPHEYRDSVMFRCAC